MIEMAEPDWTVGADCQLVHFFLVFIDGKITLLSEVGPVHGTKVFPSDVALLFYCPSLHGTKKE